MSELTPAHRQWNNDNGDLTLSFDYPLTQDSFVIELGAYQGLWTSRIIDKFNCNILAIEPIPIFFSSLSNSLSPKLILENCAVTTSNRPVELFISGDASSGHSRQGQATVVDGLTMEYLFKKHKINKVDLIQINIEGEEYGLLENWIESNFIVNFRYIQVQFHSFVDNCVVRRRNIQEGLLSKNFRSKYNYDFIWEAWENLNYGSK